jgi:amino acid adenylation domain-containing protein
MSNRVARGLQALGVRRGDRVGILVHKSPASVVGVFGILKAGGIYVPLDPAAPAERLAYIAENCDLRVVISAADLQGLVAQMRAHGPRPAVVLWTDDRPVDQANLPGMESMAWSHVQALDAAPVPPTGVIETDLAYLLYTSGSTGSPKGVMIAHRTVFTFIRWCQDTVRLTPDDRVTSHAPLHFDLSTFDLYVTLASGATAVLVPEKLSVFPERLVELLETERITVTYLVPSILSLMVTFGRLADHDLSALRTVLFAGEVFPIKYLRQLAAALPGTALYNLYGPTETNVCTYYAVQPRDLLPDRTQPVPIGIACENSNVFAVDDQGELVTQVGTEGELWVRGSCVAQGYWGDAERTARNFVLNPFQTGYAEIAYRTGDIVTRDADGVNWRYVGRRDHLIKSRGYRIELGEIEATLYSHPQVKETVAIAIPDELIGNRIVALVVPLEGHRPTVSDLQTHCGRRLPRYMIPERIVLCAQLPKTSSGKIDRTRLQQEQAVGPPAG